MTTGSVDSYSQKFGSHRPRDASSKNSFGDKPVREELTLHYIKETP